MRAMIRLMVARQGDEVHECADGAAALDAYAEFSPEWVTMDLELGATDGLMATEQIKSAFPAARIMIVTQHDNDALRDAALKAGACAYVLKDNLSRLRELFAGPRPPNSK